MPPLTYRSSRTNKCDLKLVELHEMDWIYGLGKKKDYCMYSRNKRRPSWIMNKGWKSRIFPVTTVKNTYYITGNRKHNKHQNHSILLRYPPEPPFKKKWWTNWLPTRRSLTQKRPLSRINSSTARIAKISPILMKMTKRSISLILLLFFLSSIKTPSFL